MYSAAATGQTRAADLNYVEPRSTLYPNLSFSGQQRLSREDRKFASFEASVSDVWSLEDCGIDPGVAHSSAQSVIDSHAQSTGKQSQTYQSPAVSSHINRVMAFQRLATQQGTNMPHFLASGAQRQPLYPSLPGFDAKFTAGKRAFEVPSLVDQRHDRIVGDFEELRDVCWNGIPPKLRPRVWRLLADYAPLNTELTEDTLRRKRDEYFNLVEQYFHTRHDEQQQDTFRQIHIDIPRMCPLVPLIQQKVVQEMFERILYIWAHRHPGSGYVQGINDLVTPFFIVFLSERVQADSKAEDRFDVASLSRQDLEAVEADTFWCFTFLLDSIQDNYTVEQPGIQSKVKNLKALISVMDNDLDQHLRRNQVEYLQFSFRWMNNLLMREIPLSATIRLWDTYLSTPNGFADFHLYVCAVFLCNWSKDVQKQPDFQSILLFLQNVPTKQWGEEKISVLTAKAYQLKRLYEDAKSHLRN
ncbi:RabGAP-TBC domain containing protein [Trichuris trichiura]|uniref:RabGAP-TBC domain containing protein n=1 Tax=Trichuris trichiura TaxID=36087 RepID=A0A077ZCZ4_TRITR|nr:RabGAP-TBC domain containing protein [Trichuris trichiura]